jgi:hypothetical protein
MSNFFNRLRGALRLASTPIFFPRVRWISALRMAKMVLGGSDPDRLIGYVRLADIYAESLEALKKEDELKVVVKETPTRPGAN